MKINWNDEKDLLKKLFLEEKKSYEAIGKIYNCTGTTIKKVLKKLGFKLKPKRKINPKETFNKGIKRTKKICKNCGKELTNLNSDFCCLECFHEFRHKLAYDDFLKHPEKYSRADYSPKAFKKDILEEQGNVCAICGCKPFWNGKNLVFVLDHIDGHASHNYRDNLRMICPNCDSQTDTFKSRNKNGERSYYRYHRSAPLETKDVENPLNDEPLTDNADGDDVPSSN